MDCILSGRRTSGATNPWLAFGVAAMLVLALGLLSFREIEWFFLKRSLRDKFGEENWITTEQLSAWLVDKERPSPVLLDVRTPAEWKVSHLPDARLVDPEADAKTAAGDLAKETPIVTYCAVGYRSGALAQRLRAAGYLSVQNLEGSIFQWANEHRPLVRDGKPVTRVHPCSAARERLLEPEVRAPLPPE